MEALTNVLWCWSISDQTWEKTKKVCEPVLIVTKCPHYYMVNDIRLRGDYILGFCGQVWFTDDFKLVPS